MILDNKNKSSKELTLEEIIQKSALRKNIDNLCVLENKINNNLHKHTNITKTPVESLSKRFLQLLEFQASTSKNTTQSNQVTQKKLKHIQSSRTQKSTKQINVNGSYNHEDRKNNFKTFYKKEQKIKPNSINPFERKDSSKKKKEKQNDYLCVDVASGNILTKPFTADENKRNFIPEYQMEKYQTLVELGTQLNKKQPSLKFMRNHESVEAKKYQSFIMTKYSMMNNFHQKSRKSIQNKTQSQNKLNTNILFPEELVNQKIQYRGIKTEGKVQNKIENVQDQPGTKGKKMKRLIININYENQLVKEDKKVGESLFKFGEKVQIEKHQLQKDKNSDINLHEKVASEISTSPAKPAGFRGTRLKSSTTCEKIKLKYFIPDFIKPSLELLMFEKKQGERIITQQIQSPIKQTKQQQKLNRTFQQLTQIITGKGMKLQPTLVLQTEIPKQSQNNNCISKQESYTEGCEKARKVSSRNKSKGRQQMSQKKVEGAICAWDNVEKTYEHKNLHELMMFSEQYGF